MKTKKICLLIMILICLLISTSCSFKGENMNSNGNISSENQFAIDTFSKFIDAIQNQDEEALKKLFSNKAYDKTYNIDENITKIIDLFNGKELSFENVWGISESISAEHGKKMIDVISNFYVKADENVYCFAMKQCTKNDFDKNNIGILSIYYIDEKNWQEECIYMPSGEWTPGINFEE